MFIYEFEERITRGYAQWITAIEHDQTRASMTIGLTKNPEFNRTEILIVFAGVVRTLSDWANREDDCMESIIGVHEETIDDMLRYCFHTEQRELLIWTTLAAEVQHCS